MQSLKEKVIKNSNLRQYSDLINKIAKVEYRSMGTQYLIEFDELVNIGFQTISILCEHDDFESYNESYLSTAIKWAIRNELRNRYRWYGVKQNKNFDEEEKNEIQDAVYRAILSTDEMNDSEKSFEVKDFRETPEEKCEYAMLASAIRDAIRKLPRRERELIESKFYNEKKLYELSDEFSISPSRISRIIKSGLDKVKDILVESEIL